MSIRKATIIAGILTLSGCGGGPESGPSPAGGAPTAATRGASAAAPKPQSAWTTFNSPDGGFSIGFPAAPQVSSQPGKLFTVHIVSCDQPGANFTVTYFDPPAQALTPDVVEATMKRDRDMSLQDIQATLKSEEKLSMKKDGKDWPGLGSVMETSAELNTSRLYAVAGRMYSLQVRQTKSQNNAADASKFFDSFKIADSRKAE
jgi:hypothetical protein